jgi:peptide/nickel transport system substrate-binding protein
MNRLFRFVLVLLAVLLVMTGAIGAQEDEMPEPGEGGAVVWGNQRGSANIDPINPLRCSGVDCADIYVLIYPALIGLDVATLSHAPNVPLALATGWEISEDGITYTISLRDDMTWSDGTPITANDVLFMWEAMNNMDPAEVSSSLASAQANVADVRVIDDYTLEVEMNAANCQALGSIDDLSAMPGHVYGWSPENAADFDYSTIAGHPEDFAPSVSAGPFKFTRLDAGTAIYFEANQGYVDAIEGGVIPEGLVYLDVPDYVVMAERLIAGQPGDVNYIHEPDTEIVPTLEQADVQLFSAAGNLWHYVSLNLADPNQSANGLDEDGNVIEQAPHPILSDVRVRQALQHAIDIDTIVNGPHAGNATAMVSGTIPSAYTIHPTLERRPFDLEEARRLLDEAGWVSTGDPLVQGGDGLRTCDGCLYAEPGTEFIIDMVNPGDVRNDVSVLLQAMFAEIGVQVEVRPLDFNTMYDDNLGTQVYDTAVAGWSGDIPFNPDQRSFFGVENDIVSADSPGFNFGSWYNAEFEELSEFIANNEGCDEEAIIEAAWRIQEIMWEEQPYLFLYTFNNVYAARPEVHGFNPYPTQGTWNIDAWNVALQQ